jgi:2-oxoglutarate ferredoxin oxidoreductase subunit beta
VIPLEHGRPIRFGPPDEAGLGSRGVVRTATGVEVVDVTPDNADDVLVHDAHAEDPTTAFALSRLTDAGVLHRAPIGIFRQVEHPTYDDLAREQLVTARGGDEEVGPREALAALLHSGDTWTVSDRG